MGNCRSKTDVSPDEDARRKLDRQISQRLVHDAKQSSSVKRMLLLGAGDSGKSTFLKQCHLLYGDGSFGDVASQRTQVFRNLLAGMVCLLQGSELLGVPIDGDNKDRAQAVLRMSGDLTDAELRAAHPTFFDDLRLLWADSGVQTVLARAHEVQVPTSTAYFFENLARYAPPDYAPSVQDMLHARTKTTGITEHSYRYKELPFIVVDIGGQRSERRKWVHAFQDVDILLFFAAASEFDQKLEEDARINRLHESIRLYQEIANSRWFAEIPTVLLLNKIDLFRDKIAKRDLRCCFPDYEAGCNFDAAIQYIAQRFVEQDKRKQRPTVHYTQATDTGLMKVIFNALIDSILQQSLCMSL